jgi:Domain of unknown function (DUF4932)
MPCCSPQRINVWQFSRTVVVLLLASYASIGFAKTEVGIQIDRRVELLSIVSRLAQLQEFAQAPTTSYTAAIDAHFARYSAHPLIKHIRVKYGGKRPDGDQIGSWEVLSLAMHLSEPPQLVPLVLSSATETPQEWDDRTLLKENLLALLRQFYIDTRCEQFFESQAAYYASVLEAQAPSIVGVDYDWLMRFVSLPVTESYRAVLSVLGVGDFSYIRVNYGSNRRDTYTILSSTSIANQFEKISRANLHETMHAFTNQLVDRHMSELYPAGKTLLANSVVASRVKGTFFNNVPYLLYESLVRAGTVKYVTDKRVFAGTRSQEIEGQEKAGFLWIRGLIEQMDYYDSNRVKYQNLDEFMPVIVEFLSGAAQRLSDAQTLAYLERTLWHAGPGEAVACAFDELGRRTDKIYAWVLCQSFAASSATPSGGTSVPVVLKIGSAGNFVSHKLPRDGSAYAPDLRNLFPANMQRNLNAKGRTANERYEALAARVLLRLSQVRSDFDNALETTVNENGTQ